MKNRSNNPEADNKTQQLYTKRARLYDSFFIKHLGWGRELDVFFRGTPYLQPAFKILDAGCGTGIITRVLCQNALKEGCQGLDFHAFDLTPGMIDIFREWIVEEGVKNVELKQADVLKPDSLPSHWHDYDLIVTSTMLEYLPKDKVNTALRNLKQLLRGGGTLLVFITRRNFLTQWLGKRWWKTNVYHEDEMKRIFQDVGFNEIKLKNFTPLWSGSIMVIEARK